MAFSPGRTIRRCIQIEHGDVTVQEAVEVIIDSVTRGGGFADVIVFL
jgi:hypothetical protein